MVGRGASSADDCANGKIRRLRRPDGYSCFRTFPKGQHSPHVDNRARCTKERHLQDQTRSPHCIRLLGISAVDNRRQRPAVPGRRLGPRKGVEGGKHAKALRCNIGCGCVRATCGACDSGWLESCSGGRIRLGSGVLAVGAGDLCEPSPAGLGLRTYLHRRRLTRHTALSHFSHF